MFKNTCFRPKVLLYYFLCPESFMTNKQLYNSDRFEEISYLGDLINLSQEEKPKTEKH